MVNTCQQVNMMCDRMIIMTENPTKKKKKYIIILSFK